MVENSDTGNDEPNWEAIARERVAASLEEETGEYSAHVSELATDIERGKTVTSEELEELWSRTTDLQEQLNGALIEMAADVDPDLEPLPGRVISMQARLHRAVWQGVAVDRAIDESLVSALVDDMTAILLAIQTGRIPSRQQDGTVQASFEEAITPLSMDEFRELFGENDDDSDDDEDNASSIIE